MDFFAVNAYRKQFDILLRAAKNYVIIQLNGVVNISKSIKLKFTAINASKKSTACSW